MFFKGIPTTGSQFSGAQINDVSTSLMLAPQSTTITHASSPHTVAKHFNDLNGYTARVTPVLRSSLRMIFFSST